MTSDSSVWTLTQQAYETLSTSEKSLLLAETALGIPHSGSRINVNIQSKGRDYIGQLLLKFSGRRKKSKLRFNHSSTR